MMAMRWEVKMSPAFLNLMFFVLILSCFAWIYGRILVKAGFSRWWFLLLFIPIVNLVMVWVFAFIKWPNLDKSS